MEQKNFETKYSIEMLSKAVDSFKEELVNLLQKESSYTKEKNNIIKQASDSIDSLKNYPEHIKNKVKEEQIRNLETTMGDLEGDYKKLIQGMIVNMDNLLEETKSNLKKLKEGTPFLPVDQKAKKIILEVNQMSEEHILRAAINSVEMIKKNFPR